VVVVIMTNLLVMMVCGTVVAVYALIVRDALRIADFSRRVALSLVLGFAVLATLFVSGYAFDDPGGLEAGVLTAAWVLPMIGASLWAWFSPRTVEPVLWVLTAAVVAMSTWWVLAPQTWQRFMDDRGPVTAIAALAVGVCLAVWGYHRPGRAAIGLAVIAISPLIGAVLAADAGYAMAGGSTVVAVSPFLTCAALYLLAWRLNRRKVGTDVALNA
jgi:peptidoglycan/LPS O-acetylase OafA/YrhL